MPCGLPVGMVGLARRSVPSGQRQRRIVPAIAILRRRPWIDPALSVIDRKHPKGVRCRPQSSGANSVPRPGIAAAPLSGKRMSFAAGGRDANRQRRVWIDPPQYNPATDPLGFACCESVDERLAHRETRCVSVLLRVTGNLRRRCGPFELKRESRSNEPTLVTSAHELGYRDLFVQPPTAAAAPSLHTGPPRPNSGSRIAWRNHAR